MIEVRGYTESERELGKLCKKSFLSIWSHQNLFTDRGSNSRNRQGKELCDLLVICGNDIIIFSDKQCSYPNSGDEILDWRRWYKKSIKESSDQIFGAEKWIREHPDRIFVDSLCRHKFPYDIPSAEEMRVHRVAVALGAGSRAAAYFGVGSSGSLMLETNIIGDAHFDIQAKPFRVGHVNPEKGFIHVLDDYTINIILRELDTIHDFVEYLRAKEDFFLSKYYLLIPGEEELLAIYLDSMLQEKKFPPDQIISPAVKAGAEAIQISEGFWIDFQKGPLAELRDTLRSNSAFYDALIEHFAGHLRAGTLAYGDAADYRSHEKNLRFLAAEPRASRYLISYTWRKKIASTPRNVRTSISIVSRWTKALIILLLFPRSVGQSDRDYRNERQSALIAYAHVSKMLRPDQRFIVCIGIEPGLMKVRRTEDLMSFDFEDWSSDDDEDARRIQLEMNVLTDVELRGTFDPPNTRRGDLFGGNRAERRRQKANTRKR